MNVRRLMGCNCPTCQPDAHPAARLVFNLPGGLLVGLALVELARNCL